MKRRVDLIWLGDSEPPTSWPPGRVWATSATPASICKLLQERLPASDAAAWLFWDGELGAPDTELMLQTLDQPGDVWHGGLRLGMSGLPRLTDFVNPTWMLNCDPDPLIEATSWRLSLRACLVRTEALRQLGGPRPEFLTLEGAALEMGHRYVSRGALMRHVPGLLPEDTDVVPPSLPLADELRFVYDRFGRFWSRIALLRAVMSGDASLGQALRAWRSVCREACPDQPPALKHDNLPPLTETVTPRVSVLIPTLDRYPYLRTLLDQMRGQTVKPIEIIVVDQTARARRDTGLADEFADLPLKLIYRDQSGQCSSRNEGLRAASGDYVLFIDDDDEVPSTLIEDHLATLQRFRADVSSGVADEVGVEPLASAHAYTRAGDVFPTNNTLVRLEVLQRSGLFDLAYERGQRADGDLGMRVYLSGALMILNPDISVLHHHAPSGGLRAHKARVVTYASSRHSLRHRQLPSATEIYLARRYFTTRQTREMLWLGVLGTFSVRGSVLKKMLKLIVSLLYLPDTLWRIRQHRRQADAMLRRFPQIAELREAETICATNAPSHAIDDVVISAPTLAGS